MVLHTRGRVGSRRFFIEEALREQSRGAFLCIASPGLSHEGEGEGREWEVMGMMGGMGVLMMQKVC